MQPIKKATTKKKTSALKAVVQWLCKNCPSCLPENGWTLECNPDIVLCQQANGIDCGPFVYKFMECISSGV